MRDRGSDYFENTRQATFVQQEYAIRNPMQFEGYGEHCWGFTACDGPGWVARVVDGVERQFFDYIARGAPFGPDDGTVAPWVVGAVMLAVLSSSSRCSPRQIRVKEGGTSYSCHSSASSGRGFSLIAPRSRHAPGLTWM
jgi:hypothetical protein